MTGNSSALWRSLSGIICIYKPPRMRIMSVYEALRQNICRELNENVPKINVPYHLNPLVVGPRYDKDSLNMYSTLIDHSTSGVAVIGIRGGWQSVVGFKNSCPLRVYHVKGRLGEASDLFFIGGVIRERATYHHVTRPILEKVLASIQSMYQKSMFDACGVNMRTQAAYDLAVEGLLKPVDHNIPVFYGIKCVHFEPPDFTIEVQCINETSLYLKKLIHTIGMRLRSVALCTAVRCIRYGPFTVEHALPRHRWKLADIQENMTVCTKIFITDAVSDRHSTPKLITSPEETWADTEQLLLEKGIIKEIRGLEACENRGTLQDSASTELRLEAGEQEICSSKQDSVT